METKNPLEIESLTTLAEKALPRQICSIYTATDRDLNFTMEIISNLATNVKLEGRFCVGLPSSPFPMNQNETYKRYVCGNHLLPSFIQDKDWLRLRWDSFDIPEFWVEITMDLKNPEETVRLVGRNIPYDSKITSYDQKESIVRIRWDSFSVPEFWAQVTFILN